MKTFFGISSIATFGATIIFGVILPIGGSSLGWFSACQSMIFWLVPICLIPLGLVLSIVGMAIKGAPEKYSRIGFFLNLGFIVFVMLLGIIGSIAEMLF